MVFLNNFFFSTCGARNGADISITDRNSALWNPHRDWGLHFSDTSHDIYNMRDILATPVQAYYDNGNPRGKPYTYKLSSTAAYGGTIFWKKGDAYKFASNFKEYP